MKNILKFISLLSLFAIAFISCNKDDIVETHEPPIPFEKKVEKAKTWIDGDLVLNCKATLKGEDKTLLPTGCPTKFNFKWNEDSTITIALKKFKVGKMPFAIYYKCRIKLLELNDSDKVKYKGNGWVKIYGKDGVTSIAFDTKIDHKKGSGSTVVGYLNVLTGEILFTIDYNKMSVLTYCIPQKIDKERINRYDEEFKKYQEDLKNYKQELLHLQRVEKAKELLLGDLVLTGRTGIFNYTDPNDSTKVINKDMTKLPTGCPMKYNFKWNEKDSTMTMSLPTFQIGKMPFAISFHINVKFLKLNDEEKKTYKDTSWLKISGKGGSSKGIYPKNGGEEDFGSNAHVLGFINVSTGEIILNTYYEVNLKDLYLPISTLCPQQKIDRNLINKYDELVQKYDEDLKIWEREHSNDENSESPAPKNNLIFNYFSNLIK